jgi:hypothetical protein
MEAGMRAPAEPGTPDGGQASGASRLRAEIHSRSADPYLVTVTAGAAPHCGTATVTWGTSDGELTVAPVPRTWAEAAGLRQVSLLWPPAEPGGYTLIVDGTGTRGQADNGPALTVTVTRAVLHRRGPAPAGSSSPCGSDCQHLIG